MNKKCFLKICLLLPQIKLMKKIATVIHMRTSFNTVLPCWQRQFMQKFFKFFSKVSFQTFFNSKWARGLKGFSNPIKNTFWLLFNVPLN